MSYYENYLSKRYHGENLLRLVSYLDSQEKLEIITKAFRLDLSQIGKYMSGHRKKDYDLHLEFDNAVICIETKVDSPENEYSDEPCYQTERVYENYSHAYSKTTHFRYITYGASEFYVKRNESGIFSFGAYSRHFINITLADILTMIEASGILNVNDYYEIKKWHELLKHEFKKRQRYLDMLGKIGEFRSLYIGDSKITDWPNNRINICVPEILLYFYSLIAHAWNNSQAKEKFGGVCVYPVGRMGKVSDAILNFSDLWNSTSLTFDGLIKSENAVYFEFNEDFNLHLKCCANEDIDANIDSLCEFVTNRSAELSLSGKYNATPERYKQGNYVLYEWDLGILDKRNQLPLIIEMMSEIIENAVDILK